LQVIRLQVNDVPHFFKAWGRCEFSEFLVRNAAKDPIPNTVLPCTILFVQLKLTNNGALEVVGEWVVDSAEKIDDSTRSEKTLLGGCIPSARVVGPLGQLPCRIRPCQTRQCSRVSQSLVSTEWRRKMPTRVKVGFVNQVNVHQVSIDNEGETANQNNEEGGSMHDG